jgi:uncharacterized protein YjiK
MVVKSVKKTILAVFIFLVFFGGQDEAKPGELIVQREVKLRDLLNDQSQKHKHEASGVFVLNDEIFVVFDNYSLVARIHTELDKAKLSGENKKGKGYEGITYDKRNDDFYFVEESLKNKGSFNARLNRVNNDFTIKSQKWLKFNFQGDNKGFEGLAMVIKKDKSYILALCEGNACESGKKGKTPGAGRIIVFKKKKKKWKDIAAISLPRSVKFVDYSGIDINAQNILAITSQESSAVWIGRLDIEKWQINDAGVVYHFPKDKNGKKTYCNIEGISWLTDDRFVVVSDASKKSQPDECREKEQSIHIVSLP